MKEHPCFFANSMVNSSPWARGVLQKITVESWYSAWPHEVPSGTLTWQWNISIFDRKYIFKGFKRAPFSIVMLVYQSVQLQLQGTQCRFPIRQISMVTGNGYKLGKSGGPSFHKCSPFCWAKDPYSFASEMRG